jgi:hypothetical protein
MEPLNDNELNQLLRQWEAPAAPPTLKSPVNPSRHSAWRWLWSGRIPVPVPVGAAVIIVAAALWIHSYEKPQFVVSPSSNAVTNPLVMPVTPDPPATVSPAERVSPVRTEKTLSETASLAGFHAVSQLEPKIVRERP